VHLHILNMSIVTNENNHIYIYIFTSSSTKTVRIREASLEPARQSSRYGRSCPLSNLQTYKSQGMRHYKQSDDIIHVCM